MSKKTLKFWVGDLQNRQSSIWKIWSKRGQVYCTAQSFSGNVKLSVHSPQDCQFGFTSDFKNIENDFVSRLRKMESYVRWKRERPNDKQMVPIAFLQFPSDGLKAKREVGKLRQKWRHFAFEPAPEGKCLECVLCSVEAPRSDAAINVIGRYKLLDYFKLGESELCLVIFRYTEFDLSALKLPTTISLNRGAYSDGLTNLEADQSIENLSATLWSKPADFEAIRNTEVSGLTVTKNAPRTE